MKRLFTATKTINLTASHWTEGYTYTIEDVKENYSNGKGYVRITSDSGDIIVNGCAKAQLLDLLTDYIPY